MTYNVFGGTLNLAQPFLKEFRYLCTDFRKILLFHFFVFIDTSNNQSEFLKWSKKCKPLLDPSSVNNKLIGLCLERKLVQVSFQPWTKGWQTWQC